MELEEHRTKQIYVINRIIEYQELDGTVPPRATIEIDSEIIAAFLNKERAEYIARGMAEAKRIVDGGEPSLVFTFTVEQITLYE